jgi:pyruvate dehydrogenase E1 component
MAQDKLSYFEPAFVDELVEIMRWSFDFMQRPEGNSVYLRLSTRALEQPDRTLSPDQIADVLAGAYWQVAPEPGAELAVVYTGAIAPEAMQAFEQIREDVPGAGLLAVPSPDRLHLDWSAALKARGQGRREVSHIEKLLMPLRAGASLVTVIDGPPATLSWLGGVRGSRVSALGLDHFGQSGDLPDLYGTYGLDVEAILDAAAAALDYGN